jgi:hypothetical protein
VSAAAEQNVPGQPGVPFADASPAEVRAALTADDATEFDRQWREVMARATAQLDLAEVLQTLQTWRRIAWVTSSTGTERYRDVLHNAQQRLRTGDRHPDAVSWNQLKAELGLPE